MKPGGEYVCNYNQTLSLSLNEEDMDTDNGSIDLRLKCGAIDIPLQIKDEPIKPVELTGISAFKWKHREKRGLEYRDGKIISGTTEFFAKSPFKDSLSKEHDLINNGWLAAIDSISGLEECQLDVPSAIKNTYQALILEFKRLRQLPSLAYYSGNLRTCAEAYVAAVEDALQKIPAGQTLTSTQNDILMLGCVIKNFDERTISMNPLHPLNVLYQLTLLEEESVGEVRDNLIEKLSALYLLPYIKDADKALYHAIEQRHSPEWRIYAQLANKRYQGARNFVQKLVCDKISQYIDHFTFLFDDLGNDMFCINLVNMGDCREVLQGLILFYSKELNKEVAPENLKRFTINIYCQAGDYNEFAVLSDQKKLREYIAVYGKDVEDISEMALILSKNIRCYYRNPKEAEYHYAHLTFYEMESSEDSGDNRMDSITTGVALGGLTSGTPSVLNSGWYKTGFGTKHIANNRLIQMAKTYNAMFRVAFSGSSYEPESAIFTQIASGEEGQLGKIYSSSNWVVFVDPKVDLSFFKDSDEGNQELMIIHYSDQYTSASGYDDITVTQKSEQYEEIIQEHLKRKGVLAQKADVHNIIGLFNAINGGWMLRLTNQVFHTNTGIIGTMGTGKTQFTKSLITQLYRDQAHNFDGTPLGILIFDYKGDYNESKEDFIRATKATVFKPYHLPFNPLALTKSRVFKPLLPIHTANAFKDTLAKVYGLGAKQQNTLFSCITKAYTAKGIDAGDPSTWKNTAPTFDMVYSIYAKHRLTRAHREKQLKMSCQALHNAPPNRT